MCTWPRARSRPRAPRAKSDSRGWKPARRRDAEFSRIAAKRYTTDPSCRGLRGSLLIATTELSFWYLLFVEHRGRSYQFAREIIFNRERELIPPAPRENDEQEMEFEYTVKTYTHIPHCRLEMYKFDLLRRWIYECLDVWLVSYLYRIWTPQLPSKYY